MCGVVYVKVVKAFGYVQQLGRNHVIGQVRLQGRTHQADPIRARVFLNELHQSSVWHPPRDDLQRICRNTDERDDIRVP